MRHSIVASMLCCSFLFVGCGDRSAPLVSAPSLAVQSADLKSNTKEIVTTEDYATVTLIGESGSRVFINDQEVGVFPESGTLEVTFDIKEVGDYSFHVYAKSEDGIGSERITIEIIKEEKSASLGTVETAGEASALTVSQGGVVFVAEKNHGVEIISIGFNDRVSADLIATIDILEAKNVLLSDDETKLYIQHEDGLYHVLDISDLSHPVEVDVIEEVEKKAFVFSEDMGTRYRISSCGLIGEDVSNPSQVERNFLLEDKEVSDVVLVDNDTKLIVAHGKEGLQLLDVSDPTTPIMIGEKSLSGTASGLSLLKKDGVLFVASGTAGVEIFDLDILLSEMMR